MCNITSPKMIGMFKESVIEDTIITIVKELDADDLAVLAGQLFGGECYYIDETGEYYFESNNEYFGALGSRV